MTGHAMLAGLTKTPELALDDTEASSLAEALSTVNSFYQVQIAEKTLAWVNLAMVGGTIYGTRLVAMRMRRDIEKRTANLNRAPRPQAAAPQPTNAKAAAPPQPAPKNEGYGDIPEEYMPTPGIFFN